MKGWFGYMLALSSLKWCPRWSEVKQNLIKWWNNQGLAVTYYVMRDKPKDHVLKPTPPEDIVRYWIDPEFRCSMAEYNLAYQDEYGELFPYFDTQIGPGSLGTFLGSEPRFDVSTVWYEPCISDPDQYNRISLNPTNNHWLDIHLALIDQGLKRSQGRYLVGIPDLIENLDTLAALRGTNELLLDLVERPGWVKDRVDEITNVWCEAFDIFYHRVKDADQGNAFSAFLIWGPGKTAKLQCDFSAMISPRMFRKFVQPSLQTQCKFLDYSLYHLDGTTAIQHLDALLEIEGLNAIEWTPQAGKPGGGSSEWFSLYKRIKQAGKGIQAVGVNIDEVIPMLDSIGPQGTFIIINSPVSRNDADKLQKALEPYYL